MASQFEEGELVLCTVDKIIGTTVFVKIENSSIEGTITTSEIAPGRIRNLRDYVIPNKKIVCKVLKAEGEKVQLSLRRVKPNERKELLEKIEKEKSYRAILKTVLGPDLSEKAINEITIEETLNEFFENIEDNKKRLEKIVSKENLEKIIKILESKKEKPKKVKQLFKISNKSAEGMNIIKNILKESCKDKCEIRYIAAGKYSAELEGKDFKEVNQKVNATVQKIEELAKKTKCEFSVEKS